MKCSRCRREVGREIWVVGRKLSTRYLCSDCYRAWMCKHGVDLRIHKIDENPFWSG